MTNEFFKEPEDIIWEQEDMSGWSIEALRDAGCAVCVFNPDEIKNAPVSAIEDRLCEIGREVIGYLQ